MTRSPAAFAIPGDITTPTGGYIYERRLLEGLRARGRDVAHLQLGGSFPDATPEDMADAIRQLKALPAECPVILDGFISATLDTDALAGLRAPCVAMVHHPLALETGLTAERRAALYQLERANLVHMAHVLVPSPTTAQTLVSQYGVEPARITIAPPGTDRPRLALAPQTPPLILSVGIQHPRKGHDVLLRALALILHLEWSAVLVGAEYDREHATLLAGLRCDLGLSERVTVAGRIPQSRLDELYARASIFALATRYEGYGLVFDEALVNGLPIVSCRTGAVVDTVPDRAGLLVPVDDPAAFADALAQMLHDAAPFRQAARSAALALPEWSETARVVGDVLDRV